MTIKIPRDNREGLGLIKLYRLLVLGHRNLIKNMKQTAVINIVKNRILLT